MKTPQNTLKYVIGLFVVVLLRLIPHPPNVEPIMPAMMPFSKKWGWISGMVFCLLSVLIYDVLTGTLGQWSLITASTYAVLGALAGIYFRNRESNIVNYVLYAIVATLVYDFVTGVVMGVLMFGMPLSETIIGQIPFTINHLLGNIVFSIIVSPLLYKWVVSNPKLEVGYLLHKLSLGGK